MIWTQIDDDTLKQCEHCIENCKHYHCRPAPYFPLLLRMHEELVRAGMLEWIETKQEICENCISREDGGCKHHFVNAHVDFATGKVLFCPGKTTPEMRQKQLAERQIKQKRGRA